jgi:elongation factor Tu
MTAALSLTAIVAGLLISGKVSASDDFAMQIMDVFTISGRGAVMTGQVSSGSISVGDTVCVPLKNGETVARPVTGIEMFRKLLERAEKGQLVGLLVDYDSKQIREDGQLHSDC